jgi:hypothetical protein
MLIRTLDEQNNGCALDKLAREYDMNKMKSKEFLYPIDRGRLMGDPSSGLPAEGSTTSIFIFLIPMYAILVKALIKKKGRLINKYRDTT